MIGWSETLYRASPPIIRSVIASTYGYYLRRSRFGSELEGLVRDAQARDYWQPAQWSEWQSRRLALVLERAATCTPHYADWWASCDPTALVDRGRLDGWPILEKSVVRARPASLLARSARKERLFVEHTSGTTGTPLCIRHSRETIRQWYALYEARCLRWNGVSHRDRWAILGGRLIKPARETLPPYWVWNRGMRQLYLSTYHLSPSRVPLYLDALLKYRVRFLVGYTSALHELAREAVRLGRCDVRLAVAITNAEPVYRYQRSAIEQAFGCPVRESYGMSEYCCGASECQAGGLHIWPEVGQLEIRGEDGALRPHGTGELICTSLLKAEMPLIRYRVGDRATVLPPETRCPCGRSLPLLAQIEGRTDDVLVTRRGERVGRLDPVFKADLPIREAQIIQETLDRIVVKYVPAEGFLARHAERIASEIRDRLGDVRVELAEVQEIPRTSNGKFRAVVSRLSGDNDRLPEGSVGNA